MTDAQLVHYAALRIQHGCRATMAELGCEKDSTCQTCVQAITRLREIVDRPVTEQKVKKIAADVCNEFASREMGHVDAELLIRALQSRLEEDLTMAFSVNQPTDAP